MEAWDVPIISHDGAVPSTGGSLACGLISDTDADSVRGCETLTGLAGIASDAFVLSSVTQENTRTILSSRTPRPGSCTRRITLLVRTRIRSRNIGTRLISTLNAVERECATVVLESVSASPDSRELDVLELLPQRLQRTCSLVTHSRIHTLTTLQLLLCTLIHNARTTGTRRVLSSYRFEFHLLCLGS